MFSIKNVLKTSYMCCVLNNLYFNKCAKMVCARFFNSKNYNLLKKIIYKV